MLSATMVAGAFAATPPSVAPSVVSVVTAGHWESGGTHGTYRVLLLRGGFEHVTSRVIAEWIADPTAATREAHVAYSKVLVDNCLCSLDTPQVEPIEGGVRVALSAELSHVPGKSLTCVFELRPKGQLLVLRQCE